MSQISGVEDLSHVLVALQSCANGISEYRISSCKMVLSEDGDVVGCHGAPVACWTPAEGGPLPSVAAVMESPSKLMQSLSLTTTKCRSIGSQLPIVYGEAK